MKKKENLREPFKLLECPVCGHAFIERPQWAYKIKTKGSNTHLVCSYTCMRKVQKKQEATKT